MKTHLTYLLPAFALAVLSPQARAEKEVVIRRIDTDSPHHAPGQPGDERDEKESVTYLGVETAPMNRTLGTQLGLPRDVGLVVIRVTEKSPASEVLKQDDVLTRLDDQVLIDMHQLGVLVRSKKDGEEIRLTLVRGGKEMTVKAKLAVHEVSRRANMMFFHHGEPGGMPGLGMMPMEDGADLERLRELPGMGPGEARDVLRMIEHERGDFFNRPVVRIRSHGEKGSTILDLPKSNISYSDEEGSVEIKVAEDKRTLTVKDASGKVLFVGPLNTADERQKLPVAASKRLEKIEADTLSFDAGDDFKPEVVPLPSEPAKTKIRYILDSGADEVSEGSRRAL